MKIIVEATQQEAHITGTDRLAYNALRELQQLDQTNHYIVICTKEFDYVQKAISASNFQVIEQRRWKGYIKLLVMPFRLLRQLRRKFIDRPDVFFTFHNLSSPRIKFAPIVSSALDLIPLIFAQQYSEGGIKDLRLQGIFRRTARVADRFVAISHHTKADLTKYMGVDPGKVEVMHLAADPSFQPVTDAKALQTVRRKYSLPERYVMTIGANEPRKNVEGAIAAFRGLPQGVKQAAPLVVVGKTWRKEKIEAAHAEDVIFTGFVDDSDLPAVYSGAAAFVFLSTYEGFGMPVLEAMACGVPVICANNTSLPEVAGNAAILVDAHETQTATAALEEILTDQKHARRLSRLGLAQARKFNWQKTAKILLQTINAAAK